jgi:hypothetical protein
VLLHSKEETDQVKEYELINTKTDKDFSLNDKYLIEESTSTPLFIVNQNKSAKIYQFDISGL